MDGQMCDVTMKTSQVTHPSLFGSLTKSCVVGGAGLCLELPLPTLPLIVATQRLWCCCKHNAHCTTLHYLDFSFEQHLTQQCCPNN